MTNWLNTLMTRRNPSTRHLGAGMDADTLRMAHELSLMEQGATKAERLELLRVLPDPRAVLTRPRGGGEGDLEADRCPAVGGQLGVLGDDGGTGHGMGPDVVGVLVPAADVVGDDDVGVDDGHQACQRPCQAHR